MYASKPPSIELYRYDSQYGIGDLKSCLCLDNGIHLGVIEAATDPAAQAWAAITAITEACRCRASAARPACA
ncbi:hypothetical protein [Actinoplanes cyaneus]|uniref:hypothetical protein n=1 Tax=Actinoplanes cyaneus TaxID=52696 RepID=UPI001941DC31|nr:hypothetical protein [Actinoplanes cyaneus]